MPLLKIVRPIISSAVCITLALATTACGDKVPQQDSATPDAEEPREIQLIKGTFEDLYPISFLETKAGKAVLIGGSAIVVGTFVYVTAGTGLPVAGSLATWLGTQVGMLAGVGSGATAAGLAILGGGTIASGGFGIAGGLAVIAAVSDIGIMLAFETLATQIPSNDTAEKYRFLKIPLPENRSHGIADVLKDIECSEDTKKEKILSISECANKARDQYNEALEALANIDPYSEKAGYDFIMKAVLEYNAMAFDEAAKTIETARTYTNKDSFLDYMSALIALSELGNLDTAVGLLGKGTEQEPEALPPYILQTMVYMDKDLPEMALATALKGLEYDKNNYLLNWRAAQIAYYNTEDYEIAAKSYERALKNVTENTLEAQCKMMIGLSIYQQQRKEESAPDGGPARAGESKPPFTDEEKMNRCGEVIEWYSDAVKEVVDQPRKVKFITDYFLEVTKEELTCTSELE